MMACLYQWQAQVGRDSVIHLLLIAVAALLCGSCCLSKLSRNIMIHAVCKEAPKVADLYMYRICTAGVIPTMTTMTSVHVPSPKSFALPAGLVLLRHTVKG